MTDHADTIRRAIMLSMHFTNDNTSSANVGEAWTHDDYDAAHASLDALVAEVEQLRKRNEESGWFIEGLEAAAEQLRAERDGYREEKQLAIESLKRSEAREQRLLQEALRAVVDADPQTGAAYIARVALVKLGEKP